MVRIVAISDTHGLHWEIGKHGNHIPDGDILVHTGDWSSYGKDRELEDFNYWLGNLPHPYKVVIAGNHDKTAWKTNKYETRKSFTNAVYLQDEELIIEGLKFYGSPWSPTFFDWYFMLDRGSQKMKDKREKIPLDTDVLLTHSPPMYKLDWSQFNSEHAGCEDLLNRINIVKPKIHIFGHIHLSYGYTRNKDTEFINAAICTEKYQPINRPICIDI